MIKLLRLNDEDVIGDIINEDERYLTLLFPFVLNYHINQNTGKESVMLSEWINLKLSSDQFITIEKSSIIGYINPSDEFLNFYSIAVEKLINKPDENTMSNSNNEVLEDMMEIIMESQNATIH